MCAHRFTHNANLCTQSGFNGKRQQQIGRGGNERRREIGLKVTKKEEECRLKAKAEHVEHLSSPG